MPIQQLPLPPRLETAPSNFVGRSKELRMLDDARSRVSAGSAREIVLVAGEAGLGKTSLVARAARDAFEHGANVLFGHSEEDLITPYQLFAETLGHYVMHAPEEQLLTHVRDHGSELVRIVPALARRFPDLPATRATNPDSERSLLFAAIVDVLAVASAEQPLILMLDDLQWADKGSLLLLRHLASSDRPMRLLILATYRNNETGALLDTLAALHRQAGVLRLELQGLNGSEVLECVQAIVGHVVDDVALGIANTVHSETDGNPFFVGELLRHLRATGVISEDGRWVATEPIDSLALPDSVRVTIVARVARLGDDCGKLLRLAAVIGRDFDFELLARASSMQESALIGILEQAEETALIQELPAGSGRYHFTHALIQHVLYQDLSGARRMAAHREIATALEDLSGTAPGQRIGELARHWCYAPRKEDVPKAIRFASQAGNSALASLAPGDASDYFEAATKLINKYGAPDAALELDTAIGLGTAQRQNGDRAFRDTLLAAGRRAAELGETAQLVRAALANDRGWHSTSGGSDPDKVAQLELALQRLPRDVPERALVLAALCAELAFGSSLERRQALADEALAIGRAVGDDAIMARILNQMAFSLTIPSRLGDSLQWTAEALTRAERLGDPMLLYFAAMYRATASIRANDVEEADRCFAIAGRLVHQLDLPPLKWEYTFHMSKRAQLAGDLAEAEKLAGMAVAIGTECGQPDAEMFYGVQLAAVNWMRGTMGELAPLLEQMVAANPGLPTIRASLAMAYAQAQRFDDATRLLDDFAASNYVLPQDTVWLNGMTEYADAAINCGDSRFSKAAYEVLEPWADQFSSAGGLTAEGPVCLYLGGLATVLGRYEDADRHLLHAEELCERNGMRFYAAVTHLRRGQMFLARDPVGDAEAARIFLVSAQRAAVEYGYGAVARDAAAVM